MHVPKSFKDMEKNLVHDLELISTLCGEYTLSKTAHDFGEEWYKTHYESTNADLNNPRFAGYIARKQTHIHKLAMVLASAESSELVLRKRHLEAAAQITTTLEADMPRVFAQIGLVGITKYADDVLQLLRTFGRMDKRTLVRHTFNLMGPDELSKALESLVNPGYGQLNHTKEGMMVCYIEKDAPRQ